MAKNKGKNQTPKKPTEGLSRREFVKNTVAMGVATTILAPLSEKLMAQTRVESDPKEYDYVVIGSGAGGGPVAANLVREGFRVCLIEAGAKDISAQAQSIMSTPGYHGAATEHPELSWSYSVKHYADPERQKLDSKYDEILKGILYPRGSGLGGSTIVNAMVTMYPDKSDWDNIVKLTNDNSWNGDAMHRYFQKIEDCHYREPITNVFTGHGRNGWLSTEQAEPSLLKQDKQLQKILLGVFQSQGKQGLQSFKLGNLDPNDRRYINKKFEGIFNTPTATLNGERSGVRRLLLKTKADKGGDRLVIKPNCLATKIEFSPFDGKKRRAVVVHFLEGASLYAADTRAASNENRSLATADFVKVKREVILAGGAFNSPQLLMLSGLGDPAHLERKGIDVLQLPDNRVLRGVGRNLQDRYEVGLVSETKEDFELVRDCSFEPGNDQCYPGYEQNKRRHIYSSNGVVIGLIKKSDPTKPNPDLFVFGLPGRFRGYYPKWSKDVLHKNEFTWAVLKGHTRNTAGRVKLKTNVATDTPDINFKYFDNGNDAAGDDLKAVVEGIKIARQVAKSGSAVIKGEKHETAKYQTDDEIAELARREAWGHHASCSNKMGLATDPYAVVDSEFKVHGTDNLRIVDASVFPNIPGLFIVVPIYMIAEKASEVIIKAAQKARRS